MTADATAVRRSIPRRRKAPAVRARQTTASVAFPGEVPDA